jgi:hypothetical protein
MMRKTIAGIAERFIGSYKEIAIEISGRFILLRVLILPVLIFVYALTFIVILTMVLIVILIVVPVSSVSKTNILGLFGRR